MKTLSDNNLSAYTTMRIGGEAKHVVRVDSETDIPEAINQYGQPIITLGEGSNIIFSDAGFSGLVLVNNIKGLSINPNGIVIAASGEIWDNIVSQCVDKNLCGIEALSNIPGTVGGGPVNNIGAYGQELKDVLVSLRAYDTQTNKFVTMQNNECGFSYRNSRFKSTDHGRFFITEITMQLTPLDGNYKQPGYDSIGTKLQELGLELSPQSVRKAVIALRTDKLPNPSKLPNTGSFYKNPVVNKEKVEQLLAEYPNMPHYSTNDDSKEKIAAGWLIEQVGLKGYRQNGFWVYDQQALVLVNENASSFKDLQAMSSHIIDTVRDKFGIVLEPEPEIK